MASTPGFLPASAKAVQISERSRSGNETQHEAEPFPGLLNDLHEHFGRYNVINSIPFSLCHARQQRPTGRPCRYRRASSQTRVREPERPNPSRKCRH